MSVKHIREYYNQVTNQYSEMMNCLKEMEEEYNKNLVSPEQFEQMKATIEPLKNNYMTISWIMFLLNKPNKKEKANKYIKQTDKQTKKLDKTKNKENIINQNKSILDKLRNKN